ncbi:MAG: redoxin domain-containing protein [Verrucomicrobiaceae bacterium]|nr:MAG: redoxin domain-containing protein [Verrucomicrobiaceae bacterium]
MKTIACLFAFVLVPALVSAKDEKAALPNATLADVKWGSPVNDAAFDKDQLAGKVVVVEEWGVNCPPCIASLPDLAKMAKSGGKKGLVVVGLERQQSTKVEYPVQSGGSAPGSSGTIPHVCVFDVTGKLVFNGNPHDEDFERAVKKALRDVKETK